MSKKKQPGKPIKKFTSVHLYLAFLMLIYAILVFVRLGSTQAPKTALSLRQGGMIDLTFTGNRPAHMLYYLGPGADRESRFSLYQGKSDGELQLTDDELIMLRTILDKIMASMEVNRKEKAGWLLKQ